MKKSDLKTGMRVKMRGGELYLVLKDCETELYGCQKLFFKEFNGTGFMYGTFYTDDLKLVENDSSYDIVEVFTTKSGYCDGNIFDKDSLKSIWKRETDYTYEGFVNGEFVVNCKTKEDSDLFLAYLIGKGIRWNSGRNLLHHNDYWDRYGKNTCYIHISKNGINYGNVDNYKSVIYFKKEMLYR